MQRKQSTSSRTITVETAAKELGISRSSAYYAAHRGELPAITVGRRVLILRRALDEMLEGKQGRGAAVHVAST